MSRFVQMHQQWRSFLGTHQHLLLWLLKLSAGAAGTFSGDNQCGKRSHANSKQKRRVCFDTLVKNGILALRSEEQQNKCHLISRDTSGGGLPNMHLPRMIKVLKGVFNGLGKFIPQIFMCRKMSSSLSNFLKAQLHSIKMVYMTPFSMVRHHFQR